MPTEKEALEEAIKEGLWTSEDDDFLETQKMFLENLNKSKNHLLLKSEKEQHQKTIDEETAKLNSKLLEKNELVKNTATHYSKNQINDYYILKSFFKNSELSDSIFSIEEFSDLTYSELADIIKINNEHTKLFSEENIQKMVLEEFYFPYMFLCEKPTELFGVPACRLTNFQLTTLLYSKVFKNIFDNNTDIPENIKKDPEALLDYASSSKEREKVKDHLSKDGNTTVFGATEADYAHMGITKDQVSGGSSLHNAAKQKGGSLNMQDLMNLS